MHFRECGGRGGGDGGGGRANGEEGGREEAGKQARSLGHLIQLLAILLWDHYTAWLLSQSARLLAAACTLYRMLLSGRRLEFLPDVKQNYTFEMVTYFLLDKPTICHVEVPMHVEPRASACCWPSCYLAYIWRHLEQDAVRRKETAKWSLLFLTDLGLRLALGRAETMNDTMLISSKERW